MPEEAWLQVSLTPPDGALLGPIVPGQAAELLVDGNARGSIIGSRIRPDMRDNRPVKDREGNLRSAQPLPNEDSAQGRHVILLQLDPELAIEGCLESHPRGHRQVAHPTAGRRAAHCFSRLARARRRGPVGNKSAESANREFPSRTASRPWGHCPAGRRPSLSGLMTPLVVRRRLGIVRAWSSPQRRRKSPIFLRRATTSCSSVQRKRNAPS